ncbi:GumC family protein [Agaribacterium haliotis]|uniref:GumC family protein n=1 Tax=Agaribacterium haliotis TaxID=2013869 RepID=UPI000BB58C7F|nr:GNVR domain-containing protein [Agaribacterium haliotis]
MNYLPIRFFQILCAAWRRRYAIVLPIVFLPVVGLFISVSSEKRYSSHTSMLIQETAKMNPFLEDLAVSAMLKERISALKTLLHSRHILSTVALDLGMIDAQSSSYDKDRAIASLSNSLSMSVAGKDLIRIDYVADSPALMKETLETVSSHFIEQLLAPERSSINDSARFLEEHLELRRKELDKTELALANFKAKHQAALPELNSMNIARLSALKQQLAEKQALLAGAKRNVGGLSQLLTSSNPVIGRIEEQIVEARSKLVLLRARYTDKHSKVQATVRRLKRLEKERQAALAQSSDLIDENKLWDIASNSTGASRDSQPVLISQLENLQSAKNRAEGLDEQVAQIQKMIAEIQGNLDNYREHESELLSLKRNLKVKRELYEDLLQRREMAEVMGSLGQFEEKKRIKIIDRPFTPSRPINLPVLVHVIAGLFAGIGLGIGLAITLEFADSSIRYRKQVEKLTGLKVLSRIPAQTAQMAMTTAKVQRPTLIEGSL